ncbi:ATP-binding protein [Curvibacter sp. CHRR-16]|uniref:AAA family ATPase n=1 Tax=Curvibacter sp. CHRR-16 TaxID=2835872 RepID=UPI001BDB6034|nr:ATP-binding protein [Curvibacter sp. CHRR-16]MBT0571049.1 ATP-binding protein [Curvibacter sp. CHRR-16]
MLIEFSVTNYRSILERQTLNMAASSYFKELESLNTFIPDQDDGVPRLLRSTVLYGPNASGKSTLIQALRFVEDQVLNSQKESQAGDAIDVVPFKLTAASRAADSEFEVTFVEQGVRYEYGFCCNSERFTEEWLIAYPLGRAQKWFHRVFDAKAGKDIYKFSTSFLGGKARHDLWKEQTRSNALFFSTAIQLNNEQLKSAFEWFKLRLRVHDSVRGFSPGYTLRRCAKDEDRQKVVAFMNSADLSIADIRLKESVFSAESLPKELPAAIRDEFLKDMAGRKLVEPRFVHKDINTAEVVEFDESEESDGTRALFAFAGPWLDVIENERVLVVDELDTSLHPLLVHHLVKRLHHEGTKAQLIFTTHDTTLLSQKLLRRDQVWFMEKDDKSATHLYPLSDFSPRDNEAIERGYLNGRYGGIPFLKDLDFYGV